jgi:hypothetical protein
MRARAAATSAYTMGMRTAGSSVRFWLVFAVAAGAVLVLAGFVAFLPLAFEEPSAAPAVADRAATLPEARAAFDRAAAALRAGDRAAYVAALPASGPRPRKAVRDLYRKLSPLPWSGFTFVISSIPGEPGRFDVRAAGELGRVGPPDRLAGERILDLRRLGDRVVVVGDQTPAAVRSEYLMAFYDPIVVQRNGLLVIADRRSGARARALADAAAIARPRLALVGITPSQPMLLSVYASMEELRGALGGGPDENRIKFFSGTAPRLDRKPWRLTDVGVLGPMLAGTGAWMPLMLAHEMTHAYTVRWFGATKHAPTLLLEGLATYVEGGRDYAPLREEVATGNQLWPLPDTLSTGSLWEGNTTDQVRLAYLEGSSLVQYVVQRWGVKELKPFFVAVADSDLSEEGVDKATRATLGVGWDDFYAGWQKYVLTIP